jgi:beta-N-acetylhexosaminidase
MAPRAFITGLSGSAITAEERAFLRASAPWGLILFKRNVQSPAQLKALVDEFRDVVGRTEAPVLIDQEGGRVQRLGPPHWPAYPPGAAFGRMYDRDPALGVAAARLGARLIGADLAALDITVDCLPVADVPVPGSDAVIGDRAYGETPAKVAALAAAAAAGLAEGGVLPVLKHLPGHGRATADSHLRLPVVGADRSTLESTDFAAFQPLAGLPMGMTAHVVFTSLDRELPATTSATIISHVIRGFIGFDGLLMSDDLSMGALSGSLADRTHAALAAGCDMALHCNGNLAEMQAVADAAPELAGVPARRAAAALAARRAPGPLDLKAARAEFARMMDGAVGAGTVAS